MNLETLIIVLLILFLHGIADFVMQTDWEAKNKSVNNRALLSHTLTYSAIMAWIGIGWDIYMDHPYPLTGFYFGGITFIFHTLTDYFTSRLNTKLWKSGNTHNFFVVIEFDQLLHYVQLLLTFYFLTK